MINSDPNIHKKHDNIKRIVAAISKSNLAEQITTIDWWEDDLVGTGFVRKNESQKVVYVFTKNMPQDRYQYDCDIYHSEDPADFTTTDQSDDASLEETVIKIEEFLLDEGVKGLSDKAE